MVNQIRREAQYLVYRVSILCIKLFLWVAGSALQLTPFVVIYAFIRSRKGGGGLEMADSLYPPQQHARCLCPVPNCAMEWQQNKHKRRPRPAPHATDTRRRPTAMVGRWGGQQRELCCVCVWGIILPNSCDCTWVTNWQTVGWVEPSQASPCPSRRRHNCLIYLMRCFGTWGSLIYPIECTEIGEVKSK